MSISWLRGDEARRSSLWIHYGRTECGTFRHCVVFWFGLATSKCAEAGMSRLVLPLDRQCLVAGLPVPVTELRFAPPRRFRFDYAWPAHRLAAEVDGAVWTGGRHTRGAGVTSDCDKTNLALEHGWRVARFTTQHVRDGRALQTIERLLMEGCHQR